MAVTMDAGVRPSAFDIAEAILNDPRLLSVAKYLGLK